MRDYRYTVTRETNGVFTSLAEFDTLAAATQEMQSMLSNLRSLPGNYTAPKTDKHPECYGDRTYSLKRCGEIQYLLFIVRHDMRKAAVRSLSDLLGYFACQEPWQLDHWLYAHAKVGQPYWVLHFKDCAHYDSRKRDQRKVYTQALLEWVQFGACGCWESPRLTVPFSFDELHRQVWKLTCLFHQSQ